MGVARHTVYNLAGSIAPMFVSVVTVPVYLHLVGDTRYGVLAIVWLFLGYFGLFDPGLSRAATYHIARLHDAPAKDRGDVFWTALAVNTGFGVLGGLVLYAIARPLFLHTFKMPPPMRAEVLACLPWLAASVPVSIISGVLGSVLQAREWFGVFNAINISSVILTQIVPLAVAYWHGPDLVWLIPAILLARAASNAPMFWAVAKAVPLGAGGGLKRRLLGELFSYGGWISISNLVTPILTTIDRMMIGSVLNAEAVAFYSVPFNLVTRLSVIPGALTTSLFPKFAREDKKNDREFANKAAVTMAAVMTPLIVIGIIVLPIFMKIWVGQDFAQHATFLGIILLLGVWVNGVALVPYVFLQANNRPDLTAMFHLVEVVPYLAMLWIGMHFFGLTGAALAWVFRVTMDAVLLFSAAGQLRYFAKISPCIVILLLAPDLAPSTLVSWKSAMAMILVVLSCGCSLQISPIIREICVRYFTRFTLQDAL
jgi:O-antigen/teichoic acid export membrane protein